jgi:hypothetical protein
MKKIKISLFLFTMAALAALTACEEIGPAIDLTGSTAQLKDTTYIDPVLPTTHKTVLVEEFTGVTCTFCPIGHQIAKEMLQDHGDSVIVVAIHNDNTLANPHAGYNDFRTQEGITISQQLGGSAAIPVASIDRKVFSGESDEVVTTGKWKNYTAQQLGLMPRVALEIDTDYDDASRDLIVSAKIHYLQNIDTTTHLSIMLVEDDIENPQTMPPGSTPQVDTFYIHHHILRDMITPALGTLTNATTEQGRVVIKEFKVTLDPNWKSENMEVVGLVHFIGSSNAVLQAASADVEQ